MTKHTSRDSVWDHALRLAVDKERFNVQRMRDIITETMSDRTVRDTLNTMVDRGWLSKESPHSNEWVPGPRISDEKVHQSPPTEETIEPTSVSDIGTPSHLNEGEIYSGVVSEFLSHKAVIQLDNGHVNLGSIDRAAVGEKVEFENIGWNWGRCISEEYIYESYSLPRDTSITAKSTTSSESTSQTHGVSRGLSKAYTMNGLLNNYNTDS